MIHSSVSATALALCSVFLPVQFTQAKAPSPTGQLEAQAGSDLLSAKASALESAVTRCIQENRKDCSRFAATVLASGRADANAIAPYLTIASIQALGREISEKELAGVIYETVKVTPDVVLDIVDAAARTAPPKLAPVIVSSAIHAVPDPYKMVESVQKPSSRQAVEPAEHVDFKADRSSKSVRPFKDDFKGANEEPYGTQTLAEAIVATVINASGSPDPSLILAAANPALDSWLPLLGAATVASPVGNAGNSNYGNEPKFPTPTPTPSPTPDTESPKPPVVSR